MPVTDSLASDEFGSSRSKYEAVETVVPVFSPKLTQQIQDQIVAYERNTGKRIPAAWRRAARPKVNAQALSETERWTTNKQERLQVILWIFSRLESAQDSTEAINQLACVIHTVEHLAKHRAKQLGKLYLPDPRLMSLPVPLPEQVGNMRLLVSYGTRHVTLFKENGAVQVQQVLTPFETLNHQEREQKPDLALLSKPGAGLKNSFQT